MTSAAPREDHRKGPICFSDLKWMPHSCKGWISHWWLWPVALLPERPQADTPICPCPPPGWLDIPSCSWVTVWPSWILWLEPEISQATNTCSLQGTPWTEDISALSPSLQARVSSTMVQRSFGAGQFFVVSGCLMHCRIFSRPSGLHPLDISRNSPVVITKNASRYQTSLVENLWPGQIY